MKSIRAILDRFDPLPLECDGFTRIASYALTEAGIAHQAMAAVNQDGVPHFWIEVGDWIVDYRLRMWTGRDMPHGVFKRTKGIEYRGQACFLPCDAVVFAVLTEGVL